MGKKKGQEYYFSGNFSEKDFDLFSRYELEPKDEEPQHTILNINKPKWNINSGGECYDWCKRHWHEITLYERITKDPFFLKTDSEVTDDKFYELIAEDPFYLASRFAQEKIQRWIKELFNDNKDISFKAMDHLKKIGTELAKKGKLPSCDLGEMAVFRADTFKKLKDNKVNKIRNDAPKRIRLKELFGNDLISKLPSRVLPSANDKLADLLTATKFNKSENTIKTYNKKYAKIPYGTGMVVKKKTNETPLKK